MTLSQRHLPVFVHKQSGRNVRACESAWKALNVNLSWRLCIRHKGESYHYSLTSLKYQRYRYSADQLTFYGAIRQTKAEHVQIQHNTANIMHEHEHEVT